MSKVEEQVVSLSLSKQLKSAGYPQEGLWWWRTYKIGAYPKTQLLRDWHIVSNDMLDDINDLEQYDSYQRIVAPTVAELGKALPPTLHTNQIINGGEQTGFTSLGSLCILKKEWKTKDTWECGYWYLKSGIGKKFRFGEEADIEANARAKMWLYLKKEGLLWSLDNDLAQAIVKAQREKFNGT